MKSKDVLRLKHAEPHALDLGTEGVEGDTTHVPLLEYTCGTPAGLKVLHSSLVDSCIIYYILIPSCVVSVDGLDALCIARTAALVRSSRQLASCIAEAYTRWRLPLSPW